MFAGAISSECIFSPAGEIKHNLTSSTVDGTLIDPDSDPRALPGRGLDAGILDKKDVVLFASLCQFVWVQGEPLPLIYEIDNEIYTRHGIDLPALQRLKAIGLISLEAAGYVKRKFGRHTRLFYFGKPTKIQFPHAANNQLDLGHVLLSDWGKALARACNARRNQEYYEYVIERWFRQGLVVSSILARG